MSRLRCGTVTLSMGRSSRLRMAAVRRCGSVGLIALWTALPGSPLEAQSPAPVQAPAPAPAQAPVQGGGVLGDWQEPGGSAIRVEVCGQDVCLRLVQLSPHEPHRVDGLNPDPAKRTRALCGLEIGSGFHLTDAADAEDGRLYDPKSGKTYNGLMQAEGDQLRLRGYVGIKAFGRTELWTRIPGGVKGGCS